MRVLLIALAILLAGCGSKKDPTRELTRHVNRVCDCKTAECVVQVMAADRGRLGTELSATPTGKDLERAHTLTARLQHCMAMAGLDDTGKPLPVPLPSASPSASAGPTPAAIATPSPVAPTTTTAPTATPTTRIPTDPKAFGGLFEFRKICQHMTDIGLRLGATAEAHDTGCANFLTELFTRCDNDRPAVIACMQLAGDKAQLVACAERCKR